MLYFKIKMFCFLEDQSQTTYMIKVQTRLVPLHNDSELVSGIISISINCNCAVLGVAWAGPTDLRLELASLQPVSHDIKLGSDWTDVHWRVLGKHKQLGAFCWEKWSYLNIWYRNKKNISEGECRSLSLPRQRQKRGDVSSSWKPQQRNCLFSWPVE